MKFHLQECGLYYGDSNPVPWGNAGTDMSEYHVRYHQRKFPEFTDDSHNALHEARWQPYPANANQAAAAQPLVAKPIKHNFPFELLGVSFVLQTKLFANTVLSDSAREPPAHLQSRVHHV